MAGLLFGTGGIPHSARIRSTISGIERIAELGLECMEIEFVQGVKMSEQTAIQVGETAAKRGVKLEKIKASQGRLLQTAHIASLCGAESIVFHAAFYLGDPPDKVYDRVKNYLRETLTLPRREDKRVWIRPETAGGISAFGTLDEILNLCSELEGLALCVDFAHLHARTGRINSYPEFTSILLQIKDRLGKTALGDMHIHVSGIDYGDKGERKHLNLKESDFQYTELLKALKDYDAQGIVICESPNLEEDALLLQATYNALPRTA